jgi:predicted Zn-dependent peptidase
VIYEELASVAQRGVTERELEKAKNRMRSAFVFGMQSNLSRAMRLAEYHLYWGDAELLRGELDRYLAVDRDDVQRVAREYFEATNRTVLDVIPASQANAQNQGGAR